MKFQRLLIKLSGESLGGKDPLDLEKAHAIATEVAQVRDKKIKIGIVIGGGNIIRGVALQKHNIARVMGDSMGMMATVINTLLMRELLLQQGCQARVITACSIEGIGEVYHHLKVMEYWEQGEILLFAGGTGHPYFTTDTAAALRAVEISAQCLIKATKVDGVYDSDPVTNPQAKKFDTLTYQQVLANRYKVMDLTAISFCMENKLPIQVLNLTQKGNLLLAVSGEKVGTLIDS